MSCMSRCDICQIHTAHSGDALGDVGQCLAADHAELLEELRERWDIPPAPAPPQTPLPEQKDLFRKERTPE